MVGTAGFEPAIYRFLLPLQCDIIHVSVSSDFELHWSLSPCLSRAEAEIHLAPC